MFHPSQSIAEVKRVAISGAAGNITAVAAVPGRKIRVLSFYLRQAAAGTVEFESGAGGTSLTGVMVTTAGDLVIDGAFNPFGHFETAAGVLLNIAAGAAAVQGWLTYQEV